MNRQSGFRCDHRRRRGFALRFTFGAASGFTMVELLVVIVIIAILIGLLVPAVGAVRRVAKEAGSKAVLTSIETGLETFKADEKLGGTYPPSVSDLFVPGEGRIVKSPYRNGWVNISVSGGGLLVWALSGADLLGPPGFKKFGAVEYWAYVTGRELGNPITASDAYALGSDDQPVHARSGPYVDASKLTVTRNRGTLNNPDFAVPADVEAREALPDLDPMPREYPLYLDSFGYPVLYWRADPAGRRLADFDPHDIDPQNRGIYHFMDNGALVTSGPGPEPHLVLNKAGEDHALDWGGGSYTPTSPPPVGTFEHYIWNQAVQARLSPHRSDSYLLVTPGYDGRYGTADDITNFEHGGQ